jgi:glycosyltransferase involved in cell wall biosynthesis
VAGPDECGLWPALARQFLLTPAPERVVRLDTVSGPLKTALLAGASLFALASEHENFGIAALEALAVGTPVLLSPFVDLAESVVAAGLGETAALEVGVWRDQLTRLLDNAPPFDDDFKQRTRAWVAKHYGWREINRELVGHYEQVIADQQRAVCSGRK